MDTFYALLIAHFVGDFILQSKRGIQNKERYKIRSPYLYKHILIHFLLILLLAGDFNIWKIALIVAVSHYLIDLAKLYSLSLTSKKQWPFFVDQALHLLVIIGISYNTQFDLIIQQLSTPNFAKFILAYLFVSFPAAIIIDKCLVGWSFDNTKLPSLPQAGKIIGIIERFLIVTFILFQQWEAIGFLITAKSVFRFNDLKLANRQLSEYILIGTLLSFAIAIFTGLLVAYP